MDAFNCGDLVLHVPCNHAFHECCIKEWFRTRHQCPVCRFALKTQALFEQQQEQQLRRARSVQQRMQEEEEEEEPSFVIVQHRVGRDRGGGGGGGGEDAEGEDSEEATRRSATGFPFWRHEPWGDQDNEQRARQVRIDDEGRQRRLGGTTAANTEPAADTPSAQRLERAQPQRREFRAVNFYHRHRYHRSTRRQSRAELPITTAAATTNNNDDGDGSGGDGEDDTRGLGRGREEDEDSSSSSSLTLPFDAADTTGGASPPAAISGRIRRALRSLPLARRLRGGSRQPTGPSSALATPAHGSTAHGS